jgi:hypothetical protein
MNNIKSIIYVKVTGVWQVGAFSMFERPTNRMLFEVEDHTNGATDRTYMSATIAVKDALAQLNKGV